MEEWKEYRLGDLINISSGFAYKGEFIGNGKNYLLGMGCVSFRDTFLVSGIRPYSGDAPDRYLAYSGDIVLATRQQSDNLPILGMPAIIPKKYDGHKMIIGANLYKVQNNSDFSNEYIYWLMKSPAYVHHIKSCQTGTTVRMITKANIEDFTFLAPKKETRDKIAQFFWNIENKIELNRRINENLEQQAQALFKSWFVDFEPFKDGKFVDSELGMIPEGWKVVETNKFMKISRNSINPTKNPNIFYAHYSIPAYDETGLPIFQYGDEIKSNKQEVADNMTLVSKLNPRIKRVWFVEKACENAICSTEFIPYQSLNNSPYFLYCYLNSKIFYDSIMTSVNGATGSHQRFQANDTLLYLFPYNEEIIYKFNTIVSGIMIHKSRLIRENMKLAQLRDTLLPKLMSGELKINDFND